MQKERQFPLVDIYQVLGDKSVRQNRASRQAIAIPELIDSRFGPRPNRANTARVRVNSNLRGRRH